MNRHKNLAEFIRAACMSKGVSLGEASRAMGKSRNWLERVANQGIRRPRVEACREIARYFSEDPNYVLQLAGYVSPPPSSNPIADEISTIACLLPHGDQLTLLEHARLLKFRASAAHGPVDHPDIPGIDWDKLDPAFARNLALFIEAEPRTILIWVEALATLPEKAVELLLLCAEAQVSLRDQTEREQAATILTRLAHTL